MSEYRYTNINTSDIDFVLRNSTVDDDDDFIDQQIYHIAFLTGEQFRDEFEKSHNKQLRKANIETTELLLANLYVCEKTGAVHVCGEEYTVVSKTTRSKVIIYVH